jgi:hypothetical protein
MFQLLGPVNPPPGVKVYQGGSLLGLPVFVGNIVKLMIVVAGLYAFINIMLAGYAFMAANGDPKQIEGAWARIYQSLIGLAFVAGSFVLAAIFGQLLFNDPGALLELRIFGPGTITP